MSLSCLWAGASAFKRGRSKSVEEGGDDGSLLRGRILDAFLDEVSAIEGRPGGKGYYDGGKGYYDGRKYSLNAVNCKPPCS